MPSNPIYETPWMWWYRYSRELGGERLCTEEHMIQFEIYAMANKDKVRSMYLTHRKSYPRRGNRYIDLLALTKNEKETSVINYIFDDLY